MTKTTTPSLIEEARQAAARVEAERRRNRGAEEFERALAPEGEAAHARIAGRRAKMADGESVPALQAALRTFAFDDDYKTAPAAGVVRRDAAGALRGAIELLTEARCAQDEARIARVVQWTDNDWSRSEWIRVKIAELHSFVPAAPDVRGLLDLVPWWTEEIRRHLRNARPTMTGPPESDGGLRAGDQVRARTSPLDE
jgi:hypothetical protein